MIYAILILVIAFVASNGVWLFVFNRMANKLMSRNYSEYVQVENLKKRAKKPEVEFKKDKLSQDEVRKVDELNNMFGIV